MEGKIKNRWLMALSAIAIQLSIGAAYAYSVYITPLANTMAGLLLISRLPLPL